MKDEDYVKMIHGMMEAREKERMLAVITPARSAS